MAPARVARFGGGQLGSLQAKGDWDGAERALREALTMRRKLLGEPQALVAISLDKLGQQRFYRHDLGEAETLLRQALAMRMQLFGEKNPEVGTNLQNLARVMQSKGDYEQAKQLYRRALEIERATLGDQDIENGDRDERGGESLRMARRP